MACQVGDGVPPRRVGSPKSRKNYAEMSLENERTHNH